MAYIYIINYCLSWSKC